MHRETDRSHDSPEAISPGETVLLLHGLGRTRASFRSMHGRLEQAGYRVIDWDYPSFSRSIDQHAARLSERLRELDADPAVTRIHFVTHSLGGIIVRKALLDGPPAKTGRLVMLAPPNRGSRLARRTGPLLGRWIRPLRELSSAPDSVVNRMAAPQGVEIGIIAAARDGKVRVEDTHLPGETDHLVVPGFHTFIMNALVVQEQTLTFLRTGRFAGGGAATRPGV